MGAQRDGRRSRLRVGDVDGRPPLLGRRRRRALLALLPRQRLGLARGGLTRGGYGNVLPRYFDVDVDAFVLDFACRDMADVGVLAGLPADKRVHAGVIDVRNLEVEQPDQVAERIRAVLAVIDAERVTLTTDCGMKQLPRTVAREKLRSLTAGAAIVRGELTGERWAAAAPRSSGRRPDCPGDGSAPTVGGCLRVHTDPPARRALALAALTGACWPRRSPWRPTRLPPTTRPACRRVPFKSPATPAATR